MFSLAQLPAPGLDDMTRPIWDARGLWMMQLQTVEGLQRYVAKNNMGEYVEQHLDNLRHYVGVALAQIAEVAGQATSWFRAGDAGSLRDVTSAYIEEVKAAKQAMLASQGTLGPKGPVDWPKAKKPALGVYGGFGAANPETTEVVTTDPGLLSQLSRPTSTNKYYGKLGVAAALLFLAYVVSR
ncbi:MAG: hypothetical protein JRD89_17270 [Deltaproteobacteria bacterium]|nr:hypothetical protein [Deltaproteobacteria bacterium]